MALNTKGILLYQTDYKLTNAPLAWTGVGATDPVYGNPLPDLQEIGEISGRSVSEREKIEITTLADDKRKYINGIQAESEYDEITFKFLYDVNVFRALVSLQQAEQQWVVDNPSVETEETGSTWTVVIPNNGGKDVFTLHALISDIKWDGAAVNGAQTMSLTLKPVKEIDITVVEAAE